MNPIWPSRKYCILFRNDMRSSCNSSMELLQQWRVPAIFAIPRFCSAKRAVANLDILVASRLLDRQPQIYTLQMDPTSRYTLKRQ